MIIIPARTDRFLNASKHPFTEWQVTKAKRAVRKEYPMCALCNVGPSFFQRNNDVHHIVPVHIAMVNGKPELIVAEFNLITMCRLHHFLVGHLGNWKDYNVQVVGSINELQNTHMRTARSGRNMNAKNRQIRFALQLCSGTFDLNVKKEEGKAV